MAHRRQVSMFMSQPLHNIHAMTFFILPTRVGREEDIYQEAHYSERKQHAFGKFMMSCFHSLRHIHAECHAWSSTLTELRGFGVQ